MHFGLHMNISLSQTCLIRTLYTLQGKYHKQDYKTIHTGSLKGDNGRSHNVHVSLHTSNINSSPVCVSLDYDLAGGVIDHNIIHSNRIIITPDEVLRRAHRGVNMGDHDITHSNRITITPEQVLRRAHRGVIKADSDAIILTPFAASGGDKGHQRDGKHHHGPDHFSRHHHAPATNRTTNGMHHGTDHSRHVLHQKQNHQVHRRQGSLELDATEPIAKLPTGTTKVGPKPLYLSSSPRI